MPGQVFAGIGQFMVPGVELTGRATGLEQGVALLQGPGIAPPQGQEVLFHVEQAPIQEPAPVLRATGDQGVTAGLEGHHGQCGTQLPQVGHILPVQAAAPVLAGMAQAGPMRPLDASGLLRPFHEHFQRRRMLAHQAIANPATEAAAIGHQVQGFEYGGLAGPIGADQQVEAGRRCQFNGLEATDVVQAQPGHPHGLAPTPPRPEAGRPA